MARQEWTAIKGHTGISYRQYESGERYYRFRQKPYGQDMLGIMEESKAIKIAGELRHNRQTSTGPQSFREMEAQAIVQVQEKAHAEEAQAIVQKRERKRIIAEEKFAQENTVASFWDRVYWPHRSQTGSAHNNKSILGVFNKWIRPQVGGTPLEEITFSDVDALLRNMQGAGMSEKTIRHAYTVFQAEWNYAQIYLSAHNKIILPVFPGKMIKLPRLNNQKTCWLERDEAFALIKALYNWRECCQRHGIIQKGPDTRDAYGMTVLSLFSGLRLGDICKLTWRDVQTAFGYARTPKGGRAYGIHLDIPVVREMLMERKEMFPSARPDDFVFKDSRGRQWKEAPQSFEDAVEELCLNYTPRRINNPLEKIDFHAMRHTFASWLAMAGTSLQTIMVLMGHESIQMTLRYARLNPAYTRKPVEDLADDFARQNKMLTDNDFVYVEQHPALEMDKKVFMLGS